MQPQDAPSEGLALPVPAIEINQAVQNPPPQPAFLSMPASVRISRGGLWANQHGVMQDKPDELHVLRWASAQRDMIYTDAMGVQRAYQPGERVMMGRVER